MTGKKSNANQDGIKTAIEAETPELFLRLQSQAKAKHITKDKILKDIRSIRRQLYRETFGDE